MGENAFFDIGGSEVVNSDVFVLHEGFVDAEVGLLHPIMLYLHLAHFLSRFLYTNQLTKIKTYIQHLSRVLKEGAERLVCFDHLGDFFFGVVFVDFWEHDAVFFK